MIDAILDTGPLVGSLDRDDQWHERAANEFDIQRVVPRPEPDTMVLLVHGYADASCRAIGLLAAKSP